MNEILTQIVTIDGPGGVGKGTISALVANALGWHLLDSGALYRVLAYYAVLQHTDLQDEEALTALAINLPVAFVNVDSPSLHQEIYLAGNLVTDQIRSENCGVATSKIAKLPRVRAALLARQKAFAQPPGLVADGRDMGTEVFPNAKFKFFLDASIKERAQRRYLQLKTGGLDVNLDVIVGEISLRDQQDRERVISPMKPAIDAIVIDTTNMSIDAVFAEIIRSIRLRG